MADAVRLFFVFQDGSRILSRTDVKIFDDAVFAYCALKVSRNCGVGITSKGIRVLPMVHVRVSPMVQVRLSPLLMCSMRRSKAGGGNS